MMEAIGRGCHDRKGDSMTKRNWPPAADGSWDGFFQPAVCRRKQRMFYGCSCMFHLSGDTSRDRHIEGS